MNRRKLDRMMVKFRSYSGRVQFYMVMPQGPKADHAAQLAMTAHRELSSFKSVEVIRTASWVILDILGKVYGRAFGDSYDDHESLAQGVGDVTREVKRWMDIEPRSRLYSRSPPQLIDAFDATVVGRIQTPSRYHLAAGQTSYYLKMVAHIRRVLRNERDVCICRRRRGPVACLSRIHAMETEAGDLAFSLYDAIRLSEAVIRCRYAVGYSSDRAVIAILQAQLKAQWGFEG